MQPSYKMPDKRREYLRKYARYRKISAKEAGV